MAVLLLLAPDESAVLTFVHGEGGYTSRVCAREHVDDDITGLGETSDNFLEKSTCLLLWSESHLAFGVARVHDGDSFFMRQTGDVCLLYTSDAADD